MNKLQMLVVLAIIMINAGCNDKETQEALYTYGIPVYGIFADKDKMTLEVGETATLIATIKPDNARDKGIVWSSKYDTVAVVDNMGRVIAKDIGETEIYATASDGGYKTASVITVITDFSTFIKGDYNGNIITAAVTCQDGVTVPLTSDAKSSVLVDLSGVTCFSFPEKVTAKITFGTDKHFIFSGEKTIKNEDGQDIAIAVVEGRVLRDSPTLSMEVKYTDIANKAKEVTYEFMGDKQ